jgi:hypothetical protein
LKNIIELINNSDDDRLIPKALVQNMEKVINSSFDIDLMEDTSEVRSLKNYLLKTNSSMKSQVSEFINSYSSISTKEKRTINKFLDNFTNWSSQHDRRMSISDDEVYNCINFVKTYIHNFVKIFPNIILNKVGYSDVELPEYLGLSSRHRLDIASFIKKYYNSLVKFYDDNNISNILENIKQSCENILYLVNDTPCYSIISYNGIDNYSIFDKTMCFLLFENYFLQVITFYINLTDDGKMMNNTNNMETEAENDELDTIENMEDDENKRFLIGAKNKSDYYLNTGNVRELKGKIADLISTFLNIMNENKEIVDIDYDKIMDNIFKLKEKEKNKVTDRLKALTNDERRVENVLKNNKLGVWGKGLQKGLTEYDKKVYDEEIQDIEDFRMIITNNINEEYDDDELNENPLQIRTEIRTENLEDDEYEMRVSAEIDEDVYDMSNMDEDYRDGFFDFEGPIERNDNYDESDYY